jgi:hypothetical protein
LFPSVFRRTTIVHDYRTTVVASFRPFAAHRPLSASGL